MRLQIGPSIDNNKVRLDFRKSPAKPNNVPSYEIEKSKADEFVILGLAGGTIVGTGIGIGISSYKKNHLMDEYNVNEISKK